MMNKAQPLIQKSFDWREFDKSPKSGFKFFLIKSVSRINFSIEGFFISFAKLGEIKKWAIKDRMKIIPFVLFNFCYFDFRAGEHLLEETQQRSLTEVFGLL